ncbi:MAG: S1 RNA-binding domain-containing protein, partial [Bacteroidales bacterium]
GGTSASKEAFEERCEHCSLMEKKAAEAERTSVKYKQAEFLSDKIGEVFKGAISGISKWGIYVLIDENKCEGLIPIRTLTDDFYYIDEENYQVVGRKLNKTYRLGDPIKIKVESVDLFKKQMDFSLVDDGEFPAEMRDFSPEKIDEKPTRQQKSSLKTSSKTRVKSTKANSHKQNRKGRKKTN